MPPTIRRSTPQERRLIYNTHHAAKVAAGHYRESLERSRHPARGVWEWCTSSELVVYFDRETGEQVIIGHRHCRGGRVLTLNGLDPKWILHDGVIYAQTESAPPTASES